MKTNLKKNTIFNFIKTFSGIIFPLITFPYINRVLLPGYVGRYNFAATYVGYFSLLASLGIGTYAIRVSSAVRKDQAKADTVSSQIFSINVCTMIFSYILLAGSLLVFQKLDGYKPVILILSSSILFSTMGADWLNQAYEDFQYITIRTVTMQGISLLAIFLFVRKSEDYIAYAVINVIASSGACIMNVFYRKKFCRVRMLWNIRKMDWKRHFPPIILLFVMLLAQNIFSNSDITMLGLMRSEREVGLYSTAVKIYNLVAQVISSILWVMLPRLSEYFAEKNYDCINDLLRKNLQLMVGIGFPCIIGIMLLAKEVVWIAGGAEYMEAEPYLILLMIALLFSLIGGSFIGNMIMLPSGREKYFMQACIAAAVVNIVMNYFGIPSYGACAAAVSTIVAHFVILLVLLPKVEQEIWLGKWDALLLGPLMGCAVIAVWCFFVKFWMANLALRLFIGIGGSILLYFIVLWLFRYELLVQMLMPLKKNKKLR